MNVVHATRADLGAVTSVLARAFADDPVQRWLFASAADEPAAIERFMAFFAERYFGLGHTYVAPGCVGAMLWAPPDLHALGEADIGPLLEIVSAEIGDETETRLTELGRAMEHLPEEPHFYLGIAAVDPARQGEGVGTALLEPMLEVCDRGGFAVHLESSNPRNLSFYRGHGFAEIADLRLGGDGGPRLVPMTRPPR